MTSGLSRAPAGRMASLDAVVHLGFFLDGGVGLNDLGDERLEVGGETGLLLGPQGNAESEEKQAPKQEDEG